MTTAVVDPAWFATATPDQLYAQYERDALSVAGRDRSRVRPDEVDDLHQVARIALLNTARRYDRSYGPKFMGYVRTAVERKIWGYLRTRRLRGFTLRDGAAIPAEFGLVSLDAPVGGNPDAAAVLDLIAAPEAGDRLTWPVATWRKLLDVLPPTPRRVVCWAYLEGLTDDQIAGRLGVSRARAHQIRHGALVRLMDEADLPAG